MEAATTKFSGDVCLHTFAYENWSRTHMNTIPKVALVTGTSSGFGQATAALLAAQGFRVFGTSRTPAPSGSTSYELIPLDVRSDLSVQECIETVLHRAGRIDLLVNNAGYALGGALEENIISDAQAQF